MNKIEKLEEHEHLILIDDEMWWSDGDIPAYEYLKNSHKEEMEILKKYLNGNKVVVQGGGHCGFVPKYLKTHFERVYTFEPNSFMFLALCLNNLDENVFKFQACLGDEHKLVNMVKNESCSSSGADFVNGKGNIPMVIIDDLNLDFCDLLMLDTEGYEYNILKGAVNTIEKFKPLICIERFWGERTLGIPESEMDKLLSSFGYSFVARSGESDHIYKYNV